VKRVFQPHYSCGAPVSRELTREKHERLFVALTPWLAELPVKISHTPVSGQISRLPTIRELGISVERNLPLPIWHYFIGEKSVGRIYNTSIFSTSLVAGSEFSLINP
jgi:hypothetical protein